MANTDQALIDFDSTRDAHEQLVLALRDLADRSVNPEASALRSLLHRVSARLTSREVRADDSNYYEREIQFLVDLRDAVDVSLETAVPWAQKREGVTWQRIADLLGVSRQSAHERYRYAN